MQKNKVFAWEEQSSDGLKEQNLQGIGSAEVQSLCVGNFIKGQVESRNEVRWLKRIKLMEPGKSQA